MATLEELYQTLENKSTSLDDTINNINLQITDLEESRSELVNRILTPSRNTMDNWLSNKVSEFTNNDPDATGSEILVEYRYVTGSTYWSSQISQPVGATLNITDWSIDKRTRVDDESSWSSWISIYTYVNVEAEQIEEPITASTNFDFGWDYIIQNPQDLDGTYGINANIQALESGVGILMSDKQQAITGVSVISSILDNN